MHERRRREQDGHRPARHWTVVGGADRQNPTDTREEVITTTRVTPIRRQKGKVNYMSKTIPESQVDMVIVGLRMLRAAISSGELSEDYARQIEGNAGGVLPTVAEIDRLCAHLDADDGDSL